MPRGGRVGTGRRPARRPPPASDSPRLSVPEDAGAGQFACHGAPSRALSGVATEGLRYEHLDRGEGAGEITCTTTRCSEGW
ncbi:hypothetical protein SBA2_810029 [Acidobacteriia bacterium SbA2]|nr:hypothetical protein SBA2_810029 [Acidobacteriia bacterium SbA2]